MDFIFQIIDEVVESVVEEKWLPIVGYEKYEVSDLGRIKRFGKIKTPYIEKTGYVTYCMSKNGKTKTELCHRLVLMTFNPTEKELDCDHINHIKNDNRFVNLRWVTHSQNSRYRQKREGLTSQYLGVSKYPRGKPWRVSCSIDGIKIHIGMFDDEHDAGRAYNEFIIKNNLQDFNDLNVVLSD